MFRIFCSLLCLFCSFTLLAQTNLEAELNGLEENKPGAVPQPNPAARSAALRALGTSGVLLVPESSNDRVMALDPMTGDVIDPDFIAADPDNLSTPIQAIMGLDGASILVSDQLEDVVQSYDLDGNYLGVFAPNGGANTAILDNIRGIAISANNTLLVSVGGGTNADSIAEFDSSGNYLGNFVASGTGGLASPFDVYRRSSDFLVAGINSDAIHQYDNSGSYIADLAAIDNFPEQIGEAANGNILVGNFTGSQEGVVELTSTGALVGVYDPSGLGGYRGAYELGNGNLLTTNGGGVHEIDRSGNLVETKIASVSARFITLMQAAQVCDPVDIQVSIGGPITITGTPGCIIDLYDTGCTSDTGSWVLLVSGLTIPDSGVLVVPGLNGVADACYVATVSGDSNQTLNEPVRTVPTLSQWGLIILMLALIALAIGFNHRLRKAQ